MTFPHEIRYVGGVAVPQAKTVAPAPTDARELAALTADIRELWRAVANLQEPSPPPDFYGIAERLEKLVQGFDKRLTTLEKGLPVQIDKARKDAIAFANKAVIELAKDGIMPMAEGISKRIDGIDERVKKQGRVIDETIRAASKRHEEISHLAAWQINTAAEQLVSEFRDHVREH